MSRIAIIIPCYNEEKRLDKQQILNLIAETDVQLFLANDGSTDNTLQIINEIAKEYSNRTQVLNFEKNSGKAGVIYKSINKLSEDGSYDFIGYFDADFSTPVVEVKRMLDELNSYKYDFIFEMDCDFSHNPLDLPRLLEACTEKGADVSIGSRYTKGGKVQNWPMGRILMSYFASVYVRIITGMKIHDATAGFVCYKRQVLEGININKIRFVGYAFQIEMKYRTYCKKFQIVEVPIIFTDRTKGQSKMSNSIIIEAVFGVIALRLKKLVNTL